MGRTNIDSIKYFEYLKKQGIDVKLKLALHCMRRYYESRGLRIKTDLKDLGAMRNKVKELIELFDSVIVMQTLFPKYFGWESIVDTTEFVLSMSKVKAVCWFKPVYNRWMIPYVNSELFTIEGYKKLDMYLQKIYADRFFGIEKANECIFRDIEERIMKIPKEYAIYTGRSMGAILKSKYNVKQKVVVVPNEFFGGSIDSAGLLTIDSLVRQGFNDAKYVAVPKEMGYLANFKGDLMGNLFDRSDILFV